MVEHIELLRQELRRLFCSHNHRERWSTYVWHLLFHPSYVFRLKTGVSNSVDNNLYRLSVMVSSEFAAKSCDSQQNISSAFFVCSSTQILRIRKLTTASQASI